jgi:hypothetical protein
MMLEALQVIKHPQSTDDEKDLAWEDFEMLIQQIDNASSNVSFPVATFPQPCTSLCFRRLTLPD